MRLLAWRIGRQPGRRAGRHRWHRASSRANCPPTSTRPRCAWSCPHTCRGGARH